MGALGKFLKGLVLFFMGGTAYMLIELLWRGHTHWCMGIVGGICFLLMGEINEFFRGTRHCGCSVPSLP